jgi:hypothetical protein
VVFEFVGLEKHRNGIDRLEPDPAEARLTALFPATAIARREGPKPTPPGDAELLAKEEVLG